MAGESRLVGASSAVSPRARSLITACDLTLGGQKSWSNPYITDGLVAMWDGEWNAGGGVHDPNATTIKDLAGSLDMNSLGSPIIGKNFVRVTGGKSAWATVTTDLFDECYESKTFSFELVIDTDNVTTSDFGLIFGGGAKDQGVCLHNNCGVGGTRYCAITYTDTGSISTENTSSGHAYMALVCDNGAIKLYYKFGTTTKTRTVTTASLRAIVSKRFALGVRYSYQTQASLSSNYHSARVHSKALTQEEVDSNYEIDKVRFGLT